MKKYLFLLLACFLACATLNSCSSNDEALDQPIVDPNGGGNGGNGGNDDPGDEIVATCSAEVTSLQPGNVSVKLTTENLKSYAYLMYTKEEMPDTAPDMQVVNATGMKGELKDGENVIRLVSGLVQSFITAEMIGDFSAAGGIITLCAGLRLTGIKRDIKVLNLLPALVLVFAASAIWTAIAG